MKVQDIRSFFNKPKAGSSSGSGRGAPSTPEAEVVDVPSRLKRGRTTKKKEDKDDSDDDGVLRGPSKTEESPTRKNPSRSSSGGGSKGRRKAPVISDDSDGEDPLPRTVREKKEKQSEPTKREKPNQDEKKPTPVERKRKAKALSDSDEEDFNPKKKSVKKEDNTAATSSPARKSTTTTTPTRKVKNEPKMLTPQKNETADVDPADYFKTEEKRKVQNANYAKYLAKVNAKPKNLGMKEVPEGAPNCLAGNTFVITGVLDSLEREACKDIVEQYGGRVTGGVSRKTTYLIVGDDPGESKVSKAKQLNIPHITEDDLFEMLRKSNPEKTEQAMDVDTTDSTAKPQNHNKRKDISRDSSISPKKSKFSSPVKVDTNDSNKKSTQKNDVSNGIPVSPKKSKEASSPVKVVKAEIRDDSSKPVKRNAVSKVSSPQKSKQSSTSVKLESSSETSSKASFSQDLTPKTSEELMWVDKYKPKALKNVVGQGKDSSNAAKLVRWLRNWFQNHASSQEKPKAAWPGLKDPEGKTFKCALLSGPPGIGKTTTAHLACKEVGYDYYELNASDTRNKSGLKANVADALTSKSLFVGKNDEGQLTKHHVLIMDEVDGMSGNEDRGGVQELIQLIKSSRIPIICICNDRNHQKIRSLANYCFDLRFNKPTIQELKGFVSSICFKEKLKIEPEKMTQLMISTDQDIRQIVHQLQMYKDGNSQQILNPRKDLRFGPWDVCRKVFSKPEHQKMSIHDKTSLFFQDYSFGPLFVQENYLKQIPVAAKGNKYRRMELISKSAASIADGDLVDNIIRKTNNWSMLPVSAVFASYIPGEFMASNTIGGIEFPQWLGKNSNRNKRHRLLQNLHTHVHLQVSGSLEALNMDYLPYLRRLIVDPLVQSDVETAAEKMETYALLREDLDSINELALWPGMKNPMDKIETKTKAAFTRAVNKEILPYSNVKVVKGKSKAKADELEGFDEDEDEAEEEEEEEEETVEKDAMIKMKVRKDGSSKAGTSSSAGKSKGKKETDAKPTKGKGSRGKK